VVDDESYIAEVLIAALRHAGYDARAEGTGRDAIAAAADWLPDLVLLDVMLPDMSGYDVCRTMITTGSDAGVIFLTARDEVAERVRGFGVGADDYVVKPFSLEEVLARVRAVLNRRAKGHNGETDDVQDEVLSYADITLDDRRHRVMRGNLQIDLSPTEYSLLRYLMDNPERVMSKPQILDSVWKYDFRGDSAVVETFVSSLRKKLNAAGPPLIHTVRGFGYVLRDDAP
jgi:two-component system OmpR family response regulator